MSKRQLNTTLIAYMFFRRKIRNVTYIIRWVKGINIHPGDLIIIKIYSFLLWHTPTIDQTLKISLPQKKTTIYARCEIEMYIHVINICAYNTRSFVYHWVLCVFRLPWWQNKHLIKTILLFLFSLLTHTLRWTVFFSLLFFFVVNQTLKIYVHRLTTTKTTTIHLLSYTCLSSVKSTFERHRWMRGMKNDILRDWKWSL